MVLNPPDDLLLLWREWSSGTEEQHIGPSLTRCEGHTRLAEKSVQEIRRSPIFKSKAANRSSFAIAHLLPTV
jgi:hypothetical protein